MRKKYTAAVCLLMLMSAMHGVDAEQAEDKQEEEVPKFTLDGVLVENEKDKFGNIITEQSYYRTGGDVNVVTRKDIEKHHYATATEAIKRLPGVRVSSPGYRGGEYGVGQMNTFVQINGDDRVVICIDGRRVDIPASGLMSDYGADTTKALVNLDQVTSVDNIEKIEVIKGPGASIYGADATGGVINIITRRGTLKPSGTVDVATGSWGRHIYRLNYSGSTDDGSLRYFLSANRDMSGDTKYYDRLTDKTQTYNGTAWKDEGINLSIDKAFDKTHNLRVSYNHTNGKDGYPMSSPDYRYMGEKDYLYAIKYANWAQSNGGAAALNGFRNRSYVLGLTGSYTAYSTNDVDVTYSFNKDHEMESFIRIYNQSHNYWSRKQESIVSVDKYGNKRPTGLWPGHPDWDYWIGQSQADDVATPTYVKEDNKGVQLQLGKSFGKHDVLGGVQYDASKRQSWHIYTPDWQTVPQYKREIERNTIRGYLQDKIHVSDKWDFTPSVRYEHYDSYKTNNGTYGEITDARSGSSILTYALNTQYAFDDKSSVFAGWTRINRPIAMSAYTETDDDYLYKGMQLEDEKGNALTLGIRRDFSSKTSGSINYNYLKMSNAVAELSLWDDKNERWAKKSVNAKQDRQAINLNLEHHFDDNLSLSASYAYVKEEWKAKSGAIIRPGVEIGQELLNGYINAYRPTNQYMLDLTYTKDKWNVLLSTSYYTGCSSLFTSNKFLIMDMNINYKINDKVSTYLQLNNLTNEGYELYSMSYLGQGAFAQPGRSFLLGVNYKF